MNNRVSCSRCRSLAVAILATLPNVVCAETPFFELDPLMVTAQKREQAIQEVPISITALSSSWLNTFEIRDLEEFSHFVPGLQIQLQSPKTPSFVIRGLTSDDSDVRVPGRVSIYQDGVALQQLASSVVAPFDMERIEVLRGPQGTLFGRAAQTGAIHLVQNKPRNETSASVSLGFGNYGGRMGEWIVNTPLTEDEVLLRVAMMYDHRDGYTENLAGGDVNGVETMATRISLRWQPGPQTVWDVIFNYQHDTPPGTGFKSRDYPAQAGDSSPFGPVNLERGEELYVDRRIVGLTLLGEHILGDAWRLSSVTAWRTHESDESLDLDGTAAPSLWFGEYTEGTHLSQEVRLSYEGESKWRGFTGVHLLWNDSHRGITLKTDERSWYAMATPLIREALGGAGVPESLLPPFEPMVFADGTPNLIERIPAIFENYAAFPAPLNQLAALANVPLKPFHTEQSNEYAESLVAEAFADGSYQLTPKLELTAGLRLTWEEIHAGLNVPPAAEPGRLGFIAGAGSNNLYTPTAGRLQEKESFTSWVGRLAAGYALSEDSRVYASVSRGRRPNVINVTPAATNILREEVVWSVEAGYKVLAWNRRLQMDASVFAYEYSNFQTWFVDLNEFNQFVRVTRDSGDASAKGFELSAQVRVSRNLAGYFSYAFIDAEFDELNGDGDQQEYAGNRFRLTPRHSVAVGMKWEFSAGRLGTAFVAPAYHWQSQVYFEEDNTPGLEQAAYGLAQVSAGIRLFDGNWVLSGYVKNLFDKSYLIDSGNLSKAFGIPTDIAGSPRLWGIRLRAEF